MQEAVTGAQCRLVPVLCPCRRATPQPAEESCQRLLEGFSRAAAASALQHTVLQQSSSAAFCSAACQ